MAKQSPQTKKTTHIKSSTATSPAFFVKYPSAVFMILLGVLLVIFFHEAFFKGKVFSGADSVVSLVYEPYIDAAKQQGINTFWNPYVFAGMPTWGSHVPGGEFAPLLPPMVILEAYGVAQKVINILPLPNQAVQTSKTRCTLTSRVLLLQEIFF